MKIVKLIFCIQLFLFSCSEKIEGSDFDSFLHEPCMIVNLEQDNTFEGTYIKVTTIQSKDSSLCFTMPEKFFVTNENCSNWNIGWGSNEPLFDAGVENLRSIKKIDKKKGKIYLSELQRGSGFPMENQRIIFWNTAPSGFYNKTKKPIIDTKLWPEFSGKSVGFSSVEYDSLLNKWVMIIHEVDTTSIQIYAAVSDNLVDWKAGNNGQPILTAKDFEKCSWAGLDKTSKHPQTPFVSDIVRHDEKWYLFLDGYSRNGKRHIGIASSKTSLLGPYNINKSSILSPEKEGSWNDESVFFAKIQKHLNHFIMFYDGRNSEGNERIGRAVSKDLINWTIDNQNPVLDQHSGWRSSKGTSEPCHIETRGDTILLMVEGVKRFKMGFWHHYITGRMYLDKSGNVDDAQIGRYISLDEGKSFIPHKNNPVFVNDYSNIYENEHMGGNFRLIKTDTADIIIYQAKSSHQGLKYNILLRTRKKRLSYHKK